MNEDDELSDFEKFVLWTDFIKFAYTTMGGLDFARLVNMFAEWMRHYNARNKDEFVDVKGKWKR